MPLYARCVSPVNLSNAPLKDPIEDEREAIINTTLSGVLRQLASLVLHAEDVFHDLHKDFETIYNRTGTLQNRVKEVQEKANRLNAKAVIVPESDLTTFSERTVHHSTDYGQDRLLFTVGTRPAAIERLYQEAVQNPVVVLRQLDLFRSDGMRSSKFFTCTPTTQRDRLPLDIETRRPEAVEQLPNWTADEAELTSPVHPDLRFHPLGQAVSEGALYQLPQPDRVTEARAQRFTAEVVAVDVTGTGFQRLVRFRQSLVHFDYVKRRRKRRDRNRRNTIGDTRDIQEAAALRTDLPSTSGTLGGRSTATAGTWETGRDDQQTQTEADTELSTAEDDQEPSFTTHTIRADIERAMADGGASVGRLPQLSAANTFDPPAREPVYELIRSSRARLPLSVGPAAAVRRRAAAVSEASSSGHGSGGSNRTSADSERVVSPADSGTVTSPADEAPPASPRGRIASPVDSGLSDGGRLEEASFASDDTVTPDFPDADADAEDADIDGDASSAFSCDTEGYYTSFHCDSGLRSAHESEYDLVGRGSTGTGTASNTSDSGSTVVLRRRPPPPPRASSLDAGNRESIAANRESIVTVINMDAVSAAGDAPEEEKGATEAPPEEPLSAAAAAAATAATAAARLSSCSPAESDMDLPERQQDFRSKTAMTSGRIPSLCVITPPPPSDGDDTSLEWPAPASPVPALQMVTGRGPGGATVLVQPPPPLEPPPPPESAPRSPRGRSLSPHSSQTAPRPAPRPPPPGTGSLDRGVAARYGNTAAAIYGSLRRGAGQHAPPPPSASLAAPPPAELGADSPSASPLPSPPPDPRRRRPVLTQAGDREGGGTTGSTQQQVAVEVERETSPVSQQRGSRSPVGASSERPHQPLQDRVDGGPTSPPPAPLHQRQDPTPTRRSVSPVRESPAPRTVQQTSRGRSVSPPRQQQQQQRGRQPTASPQRQVELQRQQSAERPAAGLRTSPAALQQQQQLLPPNLRSPTLGQPAYQPPRALSPAEQRAVSPRDGHQYQQQQRLQEQQQEQYRQQREQQQELYRQQQQQYQQRQEQLYQQQKQHQQYQQQLQQQQRQFEQRQQQIDQQQQQQRGSPSVTPVSRLRPAGDYQQTDRTGTGSYRPNAYQPSVPAPSAHSTPRSSVPTQPTGGGRQILDDSTTDSSQSGDGVGSSDAGPQAVGGTAATGRARKPTPATGAVAVPPPSATRSSPQSVPSQDRARRSSAAAADGKTKSRLPRAFSPFNFGRASLRAKSPAAAREKEERRLANQSASEAEEEPRTDEQKLKRLKKKWLWTLPLRRREKKKKEKNEAGDDSDDEGGFRAGDGSSFVRYESPDSVSSGVSSRASTPLTDASLSSSYYEMEQYFPALNTSQSSAAGVSSVSNQSDDSGAATRHPGESAAQLTAPRPPNFSSSFLEYSPPDSGAAVATVPVQSAAYATPPSRANLVPKPPRAVAGGWPRGGPGPAQQRAVASDAIYGTRTVFARPQSLPAAGTPRAPAPPSVVRTGPPAAAAAVARSRRSWSGASPGAPSGAPGQRASWAGRPSAPAPLTPLTRPTPLTEFKQLIARQGGSPAGSAAARLSAADRLRSPTAAAAAGADSQPRSPLGVPQSPLDARNSARAVLFQNRFGGRRCRTPRTNVMATTIPESEEEPLPPARRQLFSGESSSSGGDSGSSPEAPLRMSPSSPPPPYSAGGFKPVGDARPRRSSSLREAGAVQRPTPLAASTPSGERQKFQCGSLPRGPLAATFSYGRAGERPPFRRAFSLTATAGVSCGPATTAAAAGAGGAGSPERPGSAGRVETAL